MTAMQIPLRPLFLSSLLLATSCGAKDSEPRDLDPQQPASLSETSHNAMTFHIIIDGTTLIARPDDTVAARDFASLLPMDIVLTDYAETEKISDLPRALDRSGSPSGYTPMAGDIAVYAPWGNLAIFHRGFEYSPGLVRLGRIEGNLDVLKRPGPLPARIEAKAR